MKQLSKLILLLALVFTIALALPAQAFAQTPEGDGKVVFGGSYRLSANESLNGDLVVLGGSALIENNAVVNGNVVVTGGSLDVDGKINGDVLIIGGTARLSDTANIQGDLSTVGGTLRRSENAVISGSVSIEGPNTLGVTVPNITKPAAGTLLSDSLKTVGSILWLFFQAIALAALAVVLVLFLGRPTERVAETIALQPVMSGALGLLTVVAAPGLLVILAITIILAPVSIIGLLVLLAALVFGWIAMGLELGKRMSASLKTDWAPAVSAGVGTLVLSLVAAVVSWIPCGWVAPLLVSMIGLGAVIYSKMGTVVPLKSTLTMANTASTSPEPPVNL